MSIPRKTNAEITADEARRWLSSLHASLDRLSGKEKALQEERESIVNSVVRSCSRYRHSNLKLSSLYCVYSTLAVAVQLEDAPSEHSIEARLEYIRRVSQKLIDRGEADTAARSAIQLIECNDQAPT